MLTIAWWILNGAHCSCFKDRSHPTCSDCHMQYTQKEIQNVDQDSIIIWTYKSYWVNSANCIYAHIIMCISPTNHWSNFPAASLSSGSSPFPLLPLSAANVTVCKLCDRRWTIDGYLRFFCCLSDNSANQSIISSVFKASIMSRSLANIVRAKNQSSSIVLCSLVFFIFLTHYLFLATTCNSNSMENLH